MNFATDHVEFSISVETIINRSLESYGVILPFPTSKYLEKLHSRSSVPTTIYGLIVPTLRVVDYPILVPNSKN